MDCAVTWRDFCHGIFPSKMNTGNTPDKKGGGVRYPQVATTAVEADMFTHSQARGNVEDTRV